jgi:hypothetical protein
MRRVRALLMLVALLPTLEACTSLPQFRRVTRTFEIHDDHFNKSYVTMTQGFPVTLEFALYGSSNVTIRSQGLHLDPIELRASSGPEMQPADQARVDVGPLDPGSYAITCDCNGKPQLAFVVVHRLFK